MAADFFSRWSARKQDARAGRPLEEPQAKATELGVAPERPVPPAPPAPVNGLPVDARQPHPQPSSGSQGQTPPAVGREGPGQPPVAPPTLAQAGQLTPQSDFAPFVARGVASDVKNLALKKLFADPHFNVMDRLDTYIDDYGLPDPLPPGMLQQMASAEFLNLVQREEAPPSQPAMPAPRDDASTPGVQSVPQSGALPAPPVEGNGAATDSAELPPEPSPESQPPDDHTPTPHDHTDLRLQQDHAPGRQGPGRGVA